MEQFKGIVVICVTLWSAYRKSPKEGKGGIKMDQRGGSVRNTEKSE